MKWFEEELHEIIGEKHYGFYEGITLDIIEKLVNKFGDVASPELFKEVSDALDAEVIKVARFEKEFGDIPEVPWFVEPVVKWVILDNLIPHDIISKFWDGVMGRSIKAFDVPNHLINVEKVQDWFSKGYHRYDFEKACVTQRYIVQPEDTFLLKNKNTDEYLYYDEGSCRHAHSFYNCDEFTESEAEAFDLSSYDKVKGKRRRKNKDG